MNDKLWGKIEEIVDKALTLSQEDRQTFIDRKCRNNTALKTEVTTLLDSISESEGWLDNPREYKDAFLEEITEDVNQLKTSGSLVGEKIGSYEITKQLGEGGMGTVYLAERSDGKFEHQVAIKIIRNEKASPENIRRFEQERAIMAGLNHPGIAKLFDGGITQDGFPYFIMEYVDGIPIDEYCQKNGYPITERIEICKQVLEAVRHAHENLVVHRDLKPGNILVNTSGNVKILDFGISKLLQEDQISTTNTGARLLTPKYASPEQILESSITTATDIYALGVIFYQLFSNTFPLDFEDLSHFEIEQTILEKMPSPPSSQVESSKLRKELCGDLDAIVLKAIRKEPDQRYRTSNDFLDDLEKYQKGLPVEAREDSVIYRTRKFFSRNKQGTTTVAGIILLIIGFIGFYTWKITEERNRAQLQAQKSEQISNFLIDLFSANNPSVAQGDTIPVRFVLDRGLEKIEQLKSQPQLQSQMLHSMGKVFHNLGEYSKGEDLLLKALKIQNKLDPNNREAAEINHALANIYHKAEEFSKARKHYKNSLSLRAKIGEQKNLNYATNLSDYGALLRFIGKYDSAEVLYEKVLRIQEKHLYENHPDIMTTLNNLAVLSASIGKLDEAENYYKKVLILRKKYFGNVHPRVANTMNNLSVLYRKKGSFQKAENFYKETLQVTKELYGTNHPKTAQILNNYAGFLREKKDLNRAKKMYEKSLQIRSKIYGKDHIKTGTSFNNIANIYFEKGKLDFAATYYQKAINIYKKNLGEEHKYIGIVLTNVGKVEIEQNKLKIATNTLSKSINILEKSTDYNSISLANAYYQQGQLFMKKKMLSEAAKFFHKSLSIRQKLLGDNHPDVIQNAQDLAKLYNTPEYSKKETR